MLLSEFQEIVDQIVDIDSDIDRLHTKISRLYNYKNALLSAQPFKARRADNSDLTSLSWEENEYTRLVLLWSRYGVTLPPYKRLAKRLAQAKLLIDELSLSGNEFKLLVVPPSSKVNLDHPIINQHNIVFSDNLQRAVAKTTKWKVYIVAANPLLCTNLRINEDCTLDEDIIIEGYSMPGLNVGEYAIYIATSQTTVDQSSWSLILREYNAESKLVPCISHIGNMYRFDMDYADALIGENAFRPAMEIN